MALFLMNLPGEGPRNEVGAGTPVLQLGWKIPIVTFNRDINLFTNAESVYGTCTIFRCSCLSLVK